MKRIFGLALAALLTLSACNRSPALPNPVESKDGVSYIPIDDTSFLIPDKTWLTGVSRKATDGTVGHTARLCNKALSNMVAIVVPAVVAVFVRARIC